MTAYSASLSLSLTFIRVVSPRGLPSAVRGRYRNEPAALTLTSEEFTELDALK